MGIIFSFYFYFFNHKLIHLINRYKWEYLKFIEINLKHEPPKLFYQFDNHLKTKKSPNVVIHNWLNRPLNVHVVYQPHKLSNDLYQTNSLFSDNSARIT
jgi:hypothetical protein